MNRLSGVILVDMEFTSDQITQIIIAAISGSSVITVFFGYLKSWITAKRIAADETARQINELQENISNLTDAIQGYHKYHSYVEENTRYIIEGLMLSLQSEQIIFQALRTHKINGESEAMDKKINSFLLGQARHSLHSFDNTVSIYKQEDKKK